MRVADKEQRRRASKVARVGGAETITTDIQVIAATNRDQRREINRGSVRGTG